jgi:hypothetical protein
MLRTVAKERGLMGSNSKNIEFINAGVDSYNSAQEYLYFVSDLLRYEPDMVIAYDGWNDSSFDLAEAISPFRNERHSRNQNLLEKGSSLWGASSLFFANLKYSLVEGGSRVAIFELPWRIYSRPSRREDYVVSPGPFDQRTVEYYRINHRAFLALADENLSVAMFLQPVVGVDGRELSDEEKKAWWYPRIAERLGNRVPFYKEARRVLAELREKSNGNHVCIADLSGAFSGVSEPVYADTGHLMPKGNEIVAGRILDQLVSCGLLFARDAHPAQ